MAKDYRYTDPGLADKLIDAIAKDTKIVVDLTGLVEQTVRLAAAAERIAAALEAQREDPDAWEYAKTARVRDMELYRDEGFQLIMLDDDGWFTLRRKYPIAGHRPRQQDAPETRPAWKVGDNVYVGMVDCGYGRIVGVPNGDDNTYRVLFDGQESATAGIHASDLEPGIPF